MLYLVNYVLCVLCLGGVFNCIVLPEEALNSWCEIVVVLFSVGSRVVFRVSVLYYCIVIFYSSVDFCNVCSD